VRRALFLGVELGLVIVAALLGLYIRSLPWFNAYTVIHYVQPFPHLMYKEYGYLHGNDPWIEYWLANKLYQHGPGYWWCLKPGCDPDASRFWYPHGRDFTHTEYPLVPLLAALSYPLVSGRMSLQAWIALLPPIAGALLVVAGYVYARRLFGRVAGVVAAWLLALLPASIDRTMAGFVEKEGIAMPLLLLSLWLLAEAFNAGSRRARLLAAVLGGVVGGLLGFTWGGFRLVPIAAAAVLLVAPLVTRGERILELCEAAIAYIVAAGVVFALSPPAVDAKAIPLTVAAAAAVPITYLLWRGCSLAAERLRVRAWIPYLGVLVAVFAAASLAALKGLIPVSGRALWALLWPMRSSFHFSALVESVAEHQPTTPAMFAREFGLVTVLALLGFAAGLYKAFRERNPGVMVPVLVGIAAYWATIGMAYFIQLGGVMSTIAAVAALSLAEPVLFPSPAAGQQARRRRKYTIAREYSDAAKALAVVLILAYVVCAAHTGIISYAAMKTTVPSILMGGVGLPSLNPGWLVALQEIDLHTPKDAAVVAWWDYGYWITVPTDRATLADGATSNGTQIAMLARILTGTEDEAVKIMKSMRLRPGHTYVLVYDVALLNETNGLMIYHPLLVRADIPKSYWMVRIAGKPVDQYFAPMLIRLPNGRMATVLYVDARKPGARHALIYRILADAAARLNNSTLVITDSPPPVKITGVYLGRIIWHEQHFKHFQPWRIIAYTLHIPGLGKGLKAYLVIAIYEWVR